MLSETPENIETSRSSFSTNGTIDPLKLYGAVIVKWVKSRGLLDYIFPQHYDYNGRFIIQGCSSAGNDIEMKIDDSSIGFINTYVSNSPLPLENLGQVTRCETWRAERGRVDKVGEAERMAPRICRRRGSKSVLKLYYLAVKAYRSEVA